MTKLLTIAAALLLITAACSKEENTTTPGNTNTDNNTGTVKRCLQSESKSYDKDGKLTSETKFYYTNGLEDSILTTSPNNPSHRTLIKFIYTSKYQRKKETYANGILQQAIVVEKLNENGFIIESSVEINGSSTGGRSEVSYTCN